MLPGHECTHFTAQKVEGAGGEDSVEVTQWQIGTQAETQSPEE